MTAYQGLDRADMEIDIPALIDILHQTGERLEQLTAGEVDTVMDRSGRTFLLRSAQNQLRLSEAAKQAAILNALPAHIVLLDKQGTIVTANAAWRKFAQANGLADVSDGVGMNYLAVCDRTLGSAAAEARCAADGIRAVLEGRSTFFSTEYTLCMPSQQRGFLLTVTPVTDDVRGGAVVMHLDISAQRRTEDSLHESQALMRSVVDTMPIRVFWKDRDARYLGCNTLFAQDAGVNLPQQVIGKTDDDMPWYAQAQQYSTLNRQVMESGDARLDMDQELTVAGGAAMSIRISSVPLRNEHGDTIGLLGMYIDLTRSKLADAELVSRTTARDVAEAASRAKSSFLANMSHEIRTPMNAIIGLTHLLRAAGVAPEQDERMGKIEQAGQHLLSIINDILDISKIEADRVELERTDFHLSTVLNNIQSLTGEQAQAKGLVIDIESDGVPVWLRGDPTRLRQALLNFVSNAVKFTAHGVITIRAILLEEAADDVMVRFEVQDAGAGIPADKLPMLFQAFEQADTTTTRVYGGTGLGLTIARRLAGLMGGEAGATSTVGVGSTFWFTARLGRGEGEMPTVALVESRDAEDELCQRPGGALVLLAEDNEINSEIAQEILRSVGITCDIAENGVEAVAMSGAKNYDLILMDMHMPEMDGLDATRAIRARPGGCTTPILAMTAAAFDEDRRRCEESGMNDFIIKPVARKTFFAKLLKWLPPPTPATVAKASADAGETLVGADLGTGDGSCAQ